MAVISLTLTASLKLTKSFSSLRLLEGKKGRKEGQMGIANNTVCVEHRVSVCVCVCVCVCVRDTVSVC